MPSNQVCKAFIQEIIPCAQKAYKHLGKVRPSICIAMACVESGYGTSAVMRSHNAYLGHKVGSGKTATTYWGGKFFDAKTSEEYQVGVHTPIKASFRAFDSMEQCVFNFYELLNTKLYKDVQAGVDYKTQMQQIKQCGYMTSSTEVDSVISIIGKYDLTKYDNEVGIETIASKGNEPILKVGSVGEWVETAQKLLNAKGYNLTVDGAFGIDTQKAVIDFQKKNYIIADGVMCKRTWKKLYQ